MNINTALINATPPVSYSEPDDLLRARVKAEFPFLASIIKDKPGDELMQGIAAGLLAIFEKSVALSVGPEVFENYDLWHTSLVQADELLHANPKAAVEALSPFYPHVTQATTAMDNKTFAAGVALAWMTAHDEEMASGIEQDLGINDAAMQMFEETVASEEELADTDPDLEALLAGMDEPAAEPPVEPAGTTFEPNGVLKDWDVTTNNPASSSPEPVPEQSSFESGILDLITEGVDAVVAMRESLTSGKVGIMVEDGGAVTISVDCGPAIPGSVISGLGEHFPPEDIWIDCSRGTTMICLRFALK